MTILRNWNALVTIKIVLHLPSDGLSPVAAPQSPTVNVNVSTAPQGQTIAGQMQNDLDCHQGIPVSEYRHSGSAQYPTLSAPH
jgi:hypothetical protein